MSGRAVFLWVVIPFVALSLLALWLTRDTPASTRPAPIPLPAPLPAAAPSLPAAPPPPRAERPHPGAPPPPPPVAEDESVPEPPPGTWTREEVRVALQSVRPLIRECLEDAELRHVGPQSVRLRFTLESQQGQGRFQRGEVVESSFQDPFVFACLQDTLADAHFPAPEGRAPLTLSQPFHVVPRKKAVP